MTPDNVYTLIRNQCNETDTTFWGESEIYTLISNGESILAGKIGLIKTTTARTTTTGTRGGITAPAGVITQVKYDSVRLVRIEKRDLGRIEGEAYGGVTSEGTPEYYYVDSNELSFSPIPDASATVDIDFNGYPVAVTTASTEFSIPDDYGHHLADYALWRMFLKDQEMREVALAYKGQWDSAVVEIESNWRDRRNVDMYATVNEYDPIETCE